MNVKVRAMSPGSRDLNKSLTVFELTNNVAEIKRTFELH